ICPPRRARLLCRRKPWHRASSMPMIEEPEVHSPEVKALPHQPPRMAPTNGIELCYEIFGAADAEPMLLIMGLGAQMVLWDDAFCQQLAARGFRVIRFDNRDIGASTKFSGGKRVTVADLFKLRFLGIPV